MKRGALVIVVAFSLATLMVTGCAKKEVVKSEEPVIRAEVPKTEPTAKPEAPTAVVQPPSPIAPATDAGQAQGTDALSGYDAAAKADFATIYFDFDKSDLRADARETLSRNAELMLKAKAKAKIKIEGHCDERGSAEYNLALGERRAKSALQYLQTLGIQPDRLSIISFGKEKPAVQGSDETAWSKNRRAEFVIVK